MAVMMDFAWQNKITQIIENPFNSRTLYRWDLPRMVGVTTFLIDTANSEINKNKNVLFISHDKKIIPKLNKRVYFKWVMGSNVIFGLRGQHYDVILIDTIDLKKEEIDSLTPCVTSNNGYILWLNSTEGNFS